MARPDLKQLPRDHVGYGLAQTHERMREDIESLRHSVFASRRTIAEAQETIARANEILARRISDH